MRVKLDENLPLQLSRLSTESGHDAVTVLDEEIGGATDAEIASVCLAEERVLVTQDVDFADIRMYPPGDYPGIVVFRLASQTRDLILEVGARLIETLAGGGMRKCSAVEDFARRGSCPPLGSGWGVAESAVPIRCAKPQLRLFIPWCAGASRDERLL